MKKAGKWIMMSSAILLNAFIIFHSILPSELSAKWSNFFSQIFEFIINNTTDGKPAEQVPVTSVKLNYTTSPLNNLEGYEETGDEHLLPIGCAKLVSATVLPAKATNKSVTYSVEGDYVKVVQSGTSFSIIGKEIGTSVITVKSKENSSILDTFTFKVIDLKAPKTFELTKDTLDIVVGGGDVAPVQIINSSLATKTYDSSVFLQRYYDTSLLTMVSSDPSVVNPEEILGVKNVLVGKSQGTATVTISNSYGASETLTVNVGAPQTNNVYEEKDDLVTYTDELDVARDSLDTGYKFDYENTIYTPLDKVALKTTNNGHVYGYRKFVNGDNHASVRLIDKNDISNYKDYEFTITDRTPTAISVNMSGLTNKDGVLTVIQGKSFSGSITASPTNAYHATYSITSSVSDFVKISVNGSGFVVVTENYGTFVLKITCNENTSLTKEYSITVVKNDVINPENENDFFQFMRKSLGHFSLFLVDGILTTLAIFMMWPRLKKWIILASSAGFGAIMALGTEWIQYICREWGHRAGRIEDSGIDFAGYLITTLIVVGILCLIAKKKDDDKHLLDMVVLPSGVATFKKTADNNGFDNSKENDRRINVLKKNIGKDYEFTINGSRYNLKDLTTVKVNVDYVGDVYLVYKSLKQKELLIKEIKSLRSMPTNYESERKAKISMLFEVANKYNPVLIFTDSYIENAQQISSYETPVLYSSVVKNNHEEHSLKDGVIDCLYNIGLPAFIGFSCYLLASFIKRGGKLVILGILGLLFIALGIFTYKSIRTHINKPGFKGYRKYYVSLYLINLSGIILGIIISFIFGKLIKESNNAILISYVFTGALLGLAIVALVHAAIILLPKLIAFIKSKFNMK